MTFEKFNLSENVLAAIKSKGFTSPSPIQEIAIPALLNGEKDIVGQAQTGTGKTAAFGIPLVELLKPNAGYIQALILAPTRELALQVCDEIDSLRGKQRISITPVYGGASIETQIRKLKDNPDIVVATPGRLIDHLNRRTIDLSFVSHVILDEADEMLNMGFIDDVKEILNYTPDKKRMLLFSATMPNQILDLAKKYMQDFEVHRIAKKELTADSVEQYFINVHGKQKFEALCRLMELEEDFHGVVFCKTRRDVDEVSEALLDMGIKSGALHGDITQQKREQTLGRFKSKRVTVLVATDVAARGIDVNNLTHVINYAVPQDSETYVHRIGRTGRAGQKGTAITFVTPSTKNLFRQINKELKSGIEERMLPSAKEIFAFKKEKLTQELIESLDALNSNDYVSIAQELLLAAPPEKVVATILKKAYHHQFEIAKIKESGDRGDRRDNDRGDRRDRGGRDNDRGDRRRTTRNGEVRLFIALGKRDGHQAKSLVAFIEEKSGVFGKRIDEVKVMDNFSFCTVNDDDANQILNKMNSKNRGNKPLVERAKG